MFSADKIRNSTHSFHPSILRAYDIRGIVNKTLDNDDAYFLGRSFASLLHKSNIQGKVAVGYDGRLTSPVYESLLVRGLTDSGIDVVRIGLVPTPLLYFAPFDLDNTVGGIMITGSHNPANYNGFKMVMDGHSVYGKDILELADIARGGDFIEGQGSFSHIDLSDKYIDKLISSAFGDGKKAKKKLKIAWDCGNGATGEIVQKLADVLPGEHVLLNEKIDGTFPAHHPDPTVIENLTQLIDVVKQKGCDLGIAFDGDGDRIGAIDNTGRVIFGDQLLLTYSRDLLSRRSGAKIIADVKTSQMILERIKEWGGKPIMWKTGHSLIKAKMKEESALLAGEMSGHVFFAEDYYGYDDALLGACKLISILQSEQGSFSDVIDTYPQIISTPEIRIDVSEEKKFSIIEDAKTHLNNASIHYSDIDGIRVSRADGWWLLRASNTQNCIVARVEGQTHETLEQFANEMIEVLKTAGVTNFPKSLTELIPIAKDN